MPPEVRIYVLSYVRSIKIVFMRVVQLALKVHSLKFKMIFLTILGNLGKRLHGQLALFPDKEMIKNMCFKSTTSS